MANGWAKRSVRAPVAIEGAFVCGGRPDKVVGAVWV